MIERLIEYSIRNRFLVLIATAVLAIAGVFALLDTPVEKAFAHFVGGYARVADRG